MNSIDSEKQVCDEGQCIESVKRGNTKAYSTIVKTYMKKAYYIALSFVKREQDALDISQDAFIKAFRHIKKFKTGGAFFPWFYKILRNLCLDWLRKHRANHRVPLENVNPASPRQANEEIKIQVWNGIEKLPFEQREILILRYFQGYSYKEMAQILGKPTGSIMSGLYYAKKNLKKKLEKV